MNEFLEQFVIEARELVSQGNDDLLALEEVPGDRERLDGAFRAFHTLKGAAGIVDFPAMARALHAAEDGLSAVRSGKAAVTPLLIDLCLACLDQVNVWIDQTQSRGVVPENADTEADAMVGRFTAMSTPPAAPPSGETRPDAVLPVARQILEAQKLLVMEHRSGATLVSAATVAINVMRAERLDREELAHTLRISAERGNAAALAQAIDTLSLALAGPPTRQYVSSPLTRAPSLSPAASPETTLRIDVARVDALVRLTGELTVAKNAVGHTANEAQLAADTAQLAASLRNHHLLLERLVAELHQTVFSLRILPLSHAFQRFPRHVRELAATLGKPARLIVEGGATEADKTIVEAIAEPLLHLVRNALDHGVEDPATRSAKAKPPIATLHLRASRTGDRVVVELEDDGAGLDTARIRDTARRRSLISDATLAAMSDEEVQELIFAPGFSTAHDITDLSGRGVGLDVVRSTIERLGGRVSVASSPGQGTRVTLALPFTVMMTSVLTVEAGGQVFGVPLDFVVETVRVPRAKVAPIGAARAFAFRNRTVPVIHLGQALGGSAGLESASEATILIVSVGGELGGLEVDRLGSRIDVMLKPPEGLLAGVPGIDGTTLLGDGRVLIVLDLHELFGNDAASA